MGKQVSQTSIETYHNEVKGEKELSQAELIYPILSQFQDRGYDAHKLNLYTSLPLGSIHRALHNMYQGMHPGLYVDYVIRKNAKNRNTKHWFRVDTCQVKEQTVGDMLVGMGWELAQPRTFRKGKSSVCLYYHDIVFVDGELSFRGHLTPSNLKVILEAVGAV